MALKVYTDAQISPARMLKSQITKYIQLVLMKCPEDLSVGCPEWSCSGINKKRSTVRSAHHITERLFHALKNFEVQIFFRLKLKKLKILWCQSIQVTSVYWFGKTKFLWRNHFLGRWPLPLTGLERTTLLSRDSIYSQPVAPARPRGGNLPLHTAIYCVSMGTGAPDCNIFYSNLDGKETNSSVGGFMNIKKKI